MQTIITQKSEAETALQDFEKEIENLTNVTKKNPRDRDKVVMDCNRLQSRCTNCIKSFQLEIKSGQIPPEKKPQLQRDLQELQAKLKKLVTELDFCKAEHKRQIEAEKPPEEAENDIEALEQAQMIGDRIQDKTEAALHRTKQQAVESREIAENIELSLAEQEEKLHGIGAELDTMQENIKRSKKLLKKIASQAATDRCVQILGCLIVSAIAIITVVYVVKFDEETKEPSFDLGAR